MLIEVIHVFPCKSQKKYTLRTFHGFFGYTKAKETFKCPNHGYKCKRIITPEEIIKDKWKHS